MGPAAARESPSTQVVLAPEVSNDFVDLSESLAASQSELGPYWQRGVSRKRARLEVVDLATGEDTSEEGSLGSEPPATLTLHADRGYDTCDSEDLDTGFVRTQGAQPGGLARPEEALAWLEAGGNHDDESASGGLLLVGIGSS